MIPGVMCRQHRYKLREEMNIKKIVSPSIQIAILLMIQSGFTQIDVRNLPDAIDIFVLHEADHLSDTYGENIWDQY